MRPPPPIGLALASILVALAVPLLRGFEVEPGSAPRHPTVLASAWLAAFFWYVSVTVWLADQFDAVRLWWTTGCGFALLHMALAMHAAHGWSHAAAFDHTARVGGFGPGVYVNDLFGAVWLADVAWMWAAPDAYRHRPRWVGWAVHGFLAFVVVNATVVFGTNALARCVAAVLLAGLVWRIIRTGS